MNLTDLFNLSLAGRREATALEFAGRTYTFGELDARSDRMAGASSGARRCRRRQAVLLPEPIAWR